MEKKLNKFQNPIPHDFMSQKYFLWNFPNQRNIKTKINTKQEIN